MKPRLIRRSTEELLGSSLGSRAPLLRFAGPCQAAKGGLGPFQGGDEDRDNDHDESRPGELSPFPPLPGLNGAFIRGNFSLVSGQAAVTAVGDYFSRVALHVGFGRFALWMWLCRFVDEDSRGLKVRSEFWNSIFIGVGAVGFFRRSVHAAVFALGFVSLLLHRRRSFRLLCGRAQSPRSRIG